mmetsp:Transcript_16882/g.14775  ORF Transcript_16882/g.14775 Transcript_16882/m.14775 type:complete len:133 (+) Transcript_16882:1-399(+)
MTLIFMALTIYSVATISLRLFRKEKPEVTRSIFFDSDPKRVTVSPEDFSFAVGLQDPYEFYHFIDETIYTLKGTYRTQNRTKDPDTGDISIEAKVYDLHLAPCSIENFGSNSDKFDGLALNKLLCPSLDLDI